MKRIKKEELDVYIFIRFINIYLNIMSMQSVPLIEVKMMLEIKLKELISLGNKDIICSKMTGLYLAVDLRSNRGFWASLFYEK